MATRHGEAWIEKYPLQPEWGDWQPWAVSPVYHELSIRYRLYTTRRVRGGTANIHMEAAGDSVKFLLRVYDARWRIIRRQNFARLEHAIQDANRTLTGLEDGGNEKWEV
jgi:hypothetical protein